MAEIATDRSVLARRGQRLEYFTIAWNCLEGPIGIGAGLLAGSISLVGFGVDSFIEVTSGSALLWRISHDADVERRERAEHLALRIVGLCFLGLAVYVTVEALSALLHREAPQRSRRTTRKRRNDRRCQTD
jgi:divalent metal cation (Fe/Co/Zn/Cd) transporter